MSRGDRKPDRRAGKAPQAQASDEKQVPAGIVVGLGASAGGLDAIKKFFAQVPPDSGLSYVVVMHLAADHESYLAELLQPHVSMPVQQVTETSQLETNAVYVIPPNANLNTIDTHLRPSELEPRGRGRAPIDHFFRTLARTHDGNSVAVVLSGSGSDGTLGLREIKESGGLTIVQDPDEAEHDGMPRSAIATGLVDLVLPVAEIAGAILRFSRAKPQIEVPGDTEEPPAPEPLLLQRLFVLLRARTGRDFTRYKRSTTLRRIKRRMQIHQIDTLPAYIELARERPDELRCLCEDLLITVTSFFRDREVFETLEERVIPLLLQDRSSDDGIRIWSAGCATGEEAYSLTMLLVEAIERLDVPPPVQIFASDLHEQSLVRAREGFYPGDIEIDVSPERLKRFFIREEGGYRIRKEVREMVVFAPHNLLADPPFSKLDLVSCRNLLIYLQRDVQAEVIELFHYALRPDGILLFGPSEVIGGNELFRTIDKKHSIYRKRNVPAPEPRLPVFPLVRSRLAARAERGGETAPAPLEYERVHLRMIEAAAAPNMLVNPDDKVVHLSAQVGRFLNYPVGESTLNALKIVREELRIELRAALHAARKRAEPVRSRPVSVQLDGETKLIVVDVRPSLEPELQGFALVLFEEQKTVPAATATQSGPSDDAQVRELEAELGMMKQRLHTLIEEYETNREEMKSSNEELQSANEELRSAMEELETSKEELQSMNEELNTLNQEHRHKVEELAQLSNDLQHLLAATDIATLFLDPELRIMRFTPKISQIFNIRETDRGRPLSDLTHRLGYRDLNRDAAQVLRTLAPVEREVTDDASRCYLTRVRPYRDAEERLGGAVVTFIDITARKQAEQAQHEAKIYAERVFENLHEPILVLTPDLRVQNANRAFCEHFRLQPRQINGQSIYELGDGQWNIPALRRMLADVLLRDQLYADYEVAHSFPVIGRRLMLLNARTLDQPKRIVLGIRDVTLRMQTESALRESEERYRALVQSAGEFAIMMLDLDGRILTWSAGAERIFGYSEAEAIGQPVSVMFTDEDRAARVPEAEMRQAATHGRAADDRWQQRKDGSRFWASGSMEALRHADGRLRGFAKVLRDSTAQKIAEDALRESETRFRAMAETVPDVLFTVTPDGTVNYVNRQIESMTGAKPKDVLGTHMWPDLIHPEDRQAAEREWVEASTLHRHYEARYRMRHWSGGYCWVIVRARSFVGEADEVTLWFGTITDVDALTRAEAAVRELNATLEERVDARTRELRAQHERLDRLIEASGSMVWTADAQGLINEDSPSWRAFTGQTVEQWLGEGWADTLHPEDRAYAQGAWARAMETQEPMNIEYRVCHAASKSWRWTNVRAVPLRDESGAISGWIGMNIDIDDRKRAEVQARELAARVTHAEAQERHRIAQILHDELQQQLYSVRIQVAQLMREAETHVAHSGIANEAHRLYEELGGIIEITRQVSIDLWPAALEGGSLVEALGWLANQLEEAYGLVVEVEAEESIRVIEESMRVLLFRITRELLFNVVKHADVDEARVELLVQGDSLVLRVSDRGSGFDVDEARVGHPSAFGLFGVQDRLRLVDGSIAIDSRPGQGTTVTVQVPVARLSEPDSERREGEEIAGE